MRPYFVKQTIVRALVKGTDLYNGITQIARENKIRAGRVTGFGAVQRSRIAYYDQKTMSYSEIDIGKPMEIICLSGNISLKTGEPFAHIHVVLSDEFGNGKGGHLLPGGTPVFSCELSIEEYEGPELVRKEDPSTGLSLWEI